MFFGRRFGAGYDPIKRHGAIAYVLAESEDDVEQPSAPDITHWYDRTSFANDLTQLDDNFPSYQATGWNGATPAIDFSGENLIAAAGGSLNTAMAGSRIPFSIFARVKFDGTGQQTLCAWVRADSGQSRSVFGISSSGKLQYLRQPNVGVPEQISSSGNVGTGRVTVGLSFTALGFATIYLNGVIAGVSSAFSSSDMEANIFKVGTGPLLPTDNLDGQVKALLVSGRASSDYEHARFHLAMSSAYG